MITNPKRVPMPEFVKELKAIGVKKRLTPVQWLTLWWLFKTNGGSVRNIADQMDRSPSTVRTHLEALVKLKYAKRWKLFRGRPYQIASKVIEEAIRNRPCWPSYQFGLTEHNPSPQFRDQDLKLSDFPK